MSQAGFEPAIPVTKRPQTYVLDRVATGIGKESLTATVQVNLEVKRNVSV
jgi:hypothetical protein